MTRAYAAVSLLFVVLAAPSVGAASQRDLAPRGEALLDIPYLAQPPQLCGGAALAMVLRYWGARDVFPEDFSALVDRSESGIRTSVLTRAVLERGWSAIALSVRSAQAFANLRSEIDKGRPIIALIEERRGVYHYVVVVGVTEDHVVVHDPARAPFRVIARAIFEQRWAAAGRWMLLVLPPALDVIAPGAEVARVDPADEHVDPGSACAVLVDEGVRLARAGHVSDAEQRLVEAVARCPTEAPGWLELAGLRFVQRRFEESAELAERSLALAPGDRTALETLASARYLEGDPIGALRAWNVLGEPTTGVISVDGVTRTHHPVVVTASGLVPRQVLTPDRFLRAERRLDELPVARATVLRYSPQGAGSADVTAIVDEQNVVPRGAIGWGAVGVGAIVRRELLVDVAGPTGQGELWSFGYRWAAHRPRVRFLFAIPTPGRLPGLLSIESFWERQAYAPAGAEDPLLLEARRRAAAHVADWATSWLRWQIGGAVDRFSEGRSYGSIETQMNLRLVDDRVSVVASWGHWTSVHEHQSFGVRGISGAWRTTKSPTVAAWSGVIGHTTVGSAAPLALWPVASSSTTRGVLLRAHRLLNDNVVTSGLLGRTLTFGTLAYDRPLLIRAFGRLGIGGFADAARASDRRPTQSPSSPWHVDIGGGIRIAGPTLGGQIRIDVAYGLRDARKALSAGYVMPWGR